MEKVVQCTSDIFEKEAVVSKQRESVRWRRSISFAIVKQSKNESGTGRFGREWTCARLG